MEVTINLDSLLSSVLPAEDFIVLTLIYEDRLKEVLEVVKGFGIKEDELESYFNNLQNDGWVKIIKEINFTSLVGCLAVREKFITLVSSKENINFEEIWDLFPESAPTAGGSRPLRSKTKDSQNFKEAKKKYLARVKTHAKHEDVLLRLKAEVTSRESQGALRYMQNIITWINQFSWEKYEPYKEAITNGPVTRSPGQEVC